MRQGSAGEAAADPREPGGRPRILFVDDEPMVLRVLQRSLRQQVKGWEMEFVLSGHAALEALSQKPFDVLVTDIQMPKMDGIELLGRVREAFPPTVRLVLSGSSGEAARKAVLVAHQFMSKPIDISALIDYIGRACDLVHHLSPAMREVVGRLSALPSLPSVYHELARAVDDPGASLDDMARIVERDPSISARVLQLANSALLGPSRPIVTIRQAVPRLGTVVLRDLVLATAVFRIFEERAPPGFSLAAAHRHALRVAQIAAALHREPSLFAAGLLHDVGQLLLATELGDRYQEVAAIAASRAIPLHQAEEQVFGVTHAEVGAYLLAIWGLPQPLVEAARHHHAPLAPEVPLLPAGIVHVANVLAEEEIGPNGHVVSELDLRYLESQGVHTRIAEWRAIAAGLK
jgi:HD-like signal output (HDOD) protein